VPPYHCPVMRFRRTALPGIAALAALLAAGCSQAVATGTASSAARASSPAAAAARSAADATPTPSPTPTASPTPVWPVVLPVPSARAGEHQTSARPPASSRVFRAEMTDLWAAVASGRTTPGLPAFFPLVAYEQVKAIGDPAADWHGRLVAEYREDIAAAHALLGRGGRRAALIRVVVPESESDWIQPGVCDNRIGYWHVAGARLVYRLRGQTRSFGISTLISWRGRWYVVHLGGELRTGAGGMVDQPAAGAGTPGPPGGC
jgi:hypothetical protein